MAKRNTKKICRQGCASLLDISRRHLVGAGGPIYDAEGYATKLLATTKLVRDKLIEWQRKNEASDIVEERGGLRLRGIVQDAVVHVLNYKNKVKDARMVRHILHIIEKHEANFLMEKKEVKSILVRAFLRLSVTMDPDAITVDELLRTVEELNEIPQVDTEELLTGEEIEAGPSTVADNPAFNELQRKRCVNHQTEEDFRGSSRHDQQREERQERFVSGPLTDGFPGFPSSEQQRADNPRDARTENLIEPPVAPRKKRKYITADMDIILSRDVNVLPTKRARRRILN